jgi:hypothetical protein
VLTQLTCSLTDSAWSGTSRGLNPRLVAQLMLSLTYSASTQCEHDKVNQRGVQLAAKPALRP